MKTGGPLFLSKKIFFLLFLFSSAARAEEPPKVTLERIVDGRGNRVCDVAKAELKAEGVRRTAWVVRGLLRSDLVLTLEAVGGQASLHGIALGGRPPLRFASPSPGGRVTAASPASSFKYFDVDLSRKTVRCNLTRLAEEADPDLLTAVSEYGLLKQGLENGSSYAPEESPVVALLAARKQPPHPSPPYRRRVPWTEGGPDADELAAAARAAVSR
ncbi:MAG: hypothetical protein ABI768_05205 [Acidobacteriota bacterium]